MVTYGTIETGAHMKGAFEPSAPVPATLNSEARVTVPLALT
jgi:hypothetical protein